MNVAFVIFAVAAATLFLVAFSASAIDNPGGPASAPASQPAATLGPPQDVTFTAKLDGTVQRYVLMKPSSFDPNAPADVLIALHGHGSDRWQYVRDGRGECKGARDAAARHGMLYVSPDYRAKTSWMGPAAEADLLQIIEELKKAYRVRRIFLVGGSMGGTSVLTFTAMHPELVAGVSSQNGLASFFGYQPPLKEIRPAIEASFGGTEEAKPEEYRKRSALLHPEAFTMPLAITAGGKDTLVPCKTVLELAEAVKKHNADVLVIHRPNGGHDTNYDDTTAAIEFVLERASRR